MVFFSLFLVNLEMRIKRYYLIAGERNEKTPKSEKNDDFQKVFKKGKSFANRQFVVYFLAKEGQTEFRVGLSVSKKLEMR